MLPSLDGSVLPFHGMHSFEASYRIAEGAIRGCWRW